MSIHDVRRTTSPAIPLQRTVGSKPAPAPEPDGADPAAETTETTETPETVPEPLAARFPWPEPWRSSSGSRPRTEYWDVETASWRSRGPRPV